MQVIEHMLTLKEEEKLMALGLLWAWWDARNKVNAGEQLKPVNDIVYKARSVADVGDVVPTVKLPGLGGSRQRYDGSLHLREHGRLILMVLFGSKRRRERGALLCVMSWGMQLWQELVPWRRFVTRLLRSRMLV